MRKFLKTLWGVIWPMLAYVGVGTLVALIWEIVVVEKHFLETGAVDFEIISESVMSSSVIQTGITALFMIPIMWLAIRRIHREKYERPSFGIYLICILGITGVVVSATIITNFLSIFYEDPLFELVNEVLEEIPVWQEILIVVLLGPIAEEMVFRGKIYETLAHAYGGAAAVIFSALLFGVFHENFTQGLYAFLLGMLLGYARYKTGSLMIPIVMHICANAMAYIFQALLYFIPFNNILYSDLVIEALLTIIGAGLAVVSIELLKHKCLGEKQREQS